MTTEFFFFTLIYNLLYLFLKEIGKIDFQTTSPEEMYTLLAANNSRRLKTPQKKYSNIYTPWMDDDVDATAFGPLAILKLYGPGEVGRWHVQN
jgi:hypothetical protein